MSLLCNQIIQVLGTIKKSFDIFFFIFVTDWIAETSFNTYFIIFLNKLWPKHSSGIHVFTCLNIQNSSCSCFLDSYNIILCQRISTKNNISTLNWMKEKTTIEITIWSLDFSVNNKNFVRWLIIWPIITYLSSIQMWVLEMNNSMRFSFIDNIWISKYFHSITVFKFVCLWIKFFIKLFFIAIIISKLSLLKFNGNFKWSNFLTIFIW